MFHKSIVTDRRKDGPNLTDKTIFCTGATGFIGTNLTSAFLRRGANVVTLVPEDEEGSIPTGLTAYRGRIENSAGLSKIFSEHRFDFIIHLAATSTVQKAFENPGEAFATNVQGTWNLFETIRKNKHDIKGIIHASTDKIYGEGKSRPYREEDPIEARHVYDISKASGDLIARGYHHNFGLPILIARFCNVYGPHDLNWSRVIPAAIRAIHENRQPVINRYLDENGKQTSFLRDFIYIDDIVDGLLLMLDAAENGENLGEAFNFGTGKFHAIEDVVTDICRLFGRDVPCEIRVEPGGEIRAQSMSYEKAHRLLGFEPGYSLEDGLVRTIQWYRDYLNR